MRGSIEQLRSGRGAGGVSLECAPRQVITLIIEGHGEPELEDQFVGGVHRLDHVLARVPAADRERAAHPASPAQRHQAGGVRLDGGGVLQTTALDIREDGIAAIYIVKNPDKLSHLAAELDFPTRISPTPPAR